MLTPRQASDQHRDSGTNWRLRGFQCSEFLYDAVRQRAQAEGVGLAQIIRRALCAYLGVPEEYPGRPGPKGGASEAQEPTTAGNAALRTLVESWKASKPATDNHEDDDYARE